MDEKLDIINPEDKDYYDGKFYMVGLYPGAGAELATFYVYAGCEEEALELVVAYLDMQPTESNLLYTTEEIENYISESFADEFQEYMQDNPDADTFQFATDYLGYFYVDATMHGASQPYFVEGNNLRVEETNDEPIVFENKEVKEENKTEDYWDATEIDRDLFLSLMKFNFGTDSKGNNYIITADGNDIKRFYAKNDAEALRVYNDVKAKWNYDDHPDLTMNIGSIAPREENKKEEDCTQAGAIQGPTTIFGSKDEKDKKEESIQGVANIADKIRQAKAEIEKGNEFDYDGFVSEIKQDTMRLPEKSEQETAATLLQDFCKGYKGRTADKDNQEIERESKEVKTESKEDTKYGDSNPDKIVPDAYCDIEKTDNGYYINCGIGTHTNLGSGNFTIYPEDYLANLHKEVKKLAKERGIKRVYDKVKTMIPEYNVMIPEYNANIESMIKDLTPFAEKSKQGQLTRADLDSIEEITGKITPNKMSTLPEFEWSGKFGRLRSLIGNLERYKTDLSNPLARADTITITESKEVKTEYYKMPDNEHIIWDSEVDYYDEEYMNDIKENQYQDYLDNFEPSVPTFEEWLDDQLDDLVGSGAYETADEALEDMRDDLQADYEDYIETYKDEPLDFDTWYSNYISDSSYEDWEILEEDLLDNVFPHIDEQVNDSVLVLSGYYGSNYPDFKSSGAGGKLFTDGTSGFRDYMGGFDRVCITTQNGILGAICNDHDGTVSGQFYTLPDDKTELIKALGYEDIIKERYDEEDLDRYDEMDLMETEFNNDLMYEGIDARDLTEHLDLLKPIKDTISGYTSDPEGTKTESKKTEAMNGFNSENSTAQQLYDDFVEFEDIDKDKWNKSTAEERIEMVRPQVIKFYKQNRAKIDDNWEDFMELLEYWNYHTEYKIFNDLAYDEILDVNENKKIESKDIKTENKSDVDLEELAKDLLDWYGSDMGNWFDEIQGNEEDIYNDLLGMLENVDKEQLTNIIQDIKEADIDDETAKACGFATTSSLLNRLNKVYNSDIEVKTENNKIPRNWKKITYKSKIDTNVDSVGDTIEVERDEWNRPIATNLRTGKTALMFLDMLRNDELSEIINIETADKETESKRVECKELKTESVSYQDLVIAGESLWRDDARIYETRVEGIYDCQTAGHGGYLVDTDVFPELAKYGDKTPIDNIVGFEEDYEALKVIWAVPEVLEKIQLDKDWYKNLTLDDVLRYEDKLNDEFRKEFPNKKEAPQLLETKTESINTDVEYSVQQKRAVDDKVWWVVVAHSNLTDKDSVEGKFKTKKEAESYRDELENTYAKSKKKTEAEDMTQVKDDIETAVEKSDSTDLEKDQVKGSLDVLKTDEESAIDGYEEFNKETEKVVDGELADAVKDQMEEIIDDEKEHIEKIDTIKKSLGEFKQIKTESKYVVEYRISDTGEVVKSEPFENFIDAMQYQGNILKKMKNKIDYCKYIDVDDDKEVKEEELFGVSDEVKADSKAKGLYTETEDKDFKVGDKVKIDYISDANEYNGQVGTLTMVRKYKYYPNGNEDEFEYKTQGTIKFDDGKEFNIPDLNREGSGIVSPVDKVEEEMTLVESYDNEKDADVISKALARKGCKTKVECVDNKYQVWSNK